MLAGMISISIRCRGILREDRRQAVVQETSYLLLLGDDFLHGSHDMRNIKARPLPFRFLSLGAGRQSPMSAPQF
jgi:hypothetical protein